MARHALKANDGAGFIRAMTDEWAELSIAHQVELVFGLKPARQKGVLELTVSAVDKSDMPDGSLRAKYTTSYPTAAVGTFEACLFQSLIRVGRILREQEKWPMGRP